MSLFLSHSYTHTRTLIYMHTSFSISVCISLSFLFAVICFSSRNLIHSLYVSTHDGTDKLADFTEIDAPFYRTCFSRIGSSHRTREKKDATSISRNFDLAKITYCSRDRACRRWLILQRVDWKQLATTCSISKHSRFLDHIIGFCVCVCVCVRDSFFVIAIISATKIEEARSIRRWRRYKKKYHDFGVIANERQNRKILSLFLVISPVLLSHCYIGNFDRSFRASVLLFLFVFLSYLH